jgi:lipopolysaccharide/colanic/teichoic acid biosynthesis glycosyltransferase
MPWWKRTIDVLGAVLGLILLAPIFVAGALAVRLSGPGAILYKQRRAGIGGKPFTIYKFRSMIANADAVKDLIRNKNEQDGPAFKIEKDPRVTRVGRFLRSTSIDELPQLWNVLRGDMSLVGPRPLPVDESTACQRWQRRRLDVAPGITCRWQVEDRRIKIPFDAWMRLDLSYIESRSLRHDLKLILRTLRAVFFRR